MSKSLQYRQTPNVGQKGTEKKVPTPQDTTSSDDDYAGVDQVTDTSDENEPDVERAEEAAIEKEILMYSDAYTEYVDGLGNPFESDDDRERYSSAFPEGVFPQESHILLRDELLVHASERPSSPSTKNSSSSDSITDDDFDLEGPIPTFLDIDSLNPNFQRAIDGEGSDYSYWEYQYDHDQRMEDSENEACGSGGFNSDDGGYKSDDTDENPCDTARNFINLGPSVLKPLETTDSDDEFDALPRKLPKMGTFSSVATEPFATVDRSGKSISLYENDRRQPEFFDYGGSPWGNIFQFNFGFQNYSTDTSSYKDDSSEHSSENLSQEKLVFADFLNECGSLSSDDEQTVSQEPCNTEIKGPLDHLRKSSVSSFRKNQDQHQQLARNMVTAESLAFAGATTVVRGIKKYKLAAANQPITPMRIRRNRRETAAASSPGSPLTQTPTPRKRLRRS